MVSESEVKEKLIRFLQENPEEKFTMTELSRRSEISMTSISKWVEVMRLEGIIEVEEYGNVKVVKLKGDQLGNAE